jgi:hypothetical protein
MNRNFIAGLAVTAILTPAAAAGQESGTAVTITGQQVVPGTRARVLEAKIIAGALESKITTGRPYSAETVTEMNQVLGDGNRIHTRSATRVYRDSEGRTRRETFDGDGTLVTISISDPVARVTYTLDPQTKTAYQAGNIMVPLTRTGTDTFPGSAGGRATGATAPLEREATATAAVGGGRGGGVVALRRTEGFDDPNVRKEDLGQQNIEGVSATGTRTTRIIPVGEIGNAQQIQVVSEQWFSDELQALVMTRHSDPRNGETVYRLTNILRAEPDQNLFTVPADYTVQERRIRRPQ